MRRRLLLAVLALIAAGGLARVRSRRRAARRIATANAAADARAAATRALPAPGALLGAGEAVPADDDAEIARPAGDPALKSDAQVEPEPTGIMKRRTSSASRFLSIPWSPHPDPPSPDATELRLHCTLTADGMELARVDVRETPSQVFVTVLARWASAAEDDALASAADPATGRKREATATLREPLGGRALVHAPHDEPPAAQSPPTPTPHDRPPR